MRKTIWWLIVIAGLGLLAWILYRALYQAPPQPAKPPPVAAPAEPQIRYPLGEAARDSSLPALGESDAAIADALGGFALDKVLADFFQLKDFVRRVVATIDNLPREKLAPRLLPLKPVPGTFIVAGPLDDYVISQRNAERYAPYMKLLEAVDAPRLVAFYVRFYPLFQQAYQELGYPKGYFNDRLVDVIDHLLAAPEAPPQARLVQPKVFYLYADPQLEARSAGHKILMRIGGANAAAVKAKLREIRAELLRQAPPKP